MEPKVPEIIGPDEELIDIDPVDIDLKHKRKNEKIKWKGHPHIASLIGTVVLGIFLILSGILLLLYSLIINYSMFVFLVSILFLITGPISLFFVKFHIKYTRYILTDAAVYKQTGWISDKVVKIPLDKLQTITYEQSITEKALNFGTICMSTGGHEMIELEFKSVKNPSKVNERVEDQMEERVERARTVVQEDQMDRIKQLEEELERAKNRQLESK